MKATRRASQRRAEIIIIICMVVVAVIFIMPYIWMLLDSFKPMKEIIKGKSFWPEDFTFKNYNTVLTKAPILTWLRNSTITAVTGTVIMLFTSTLAGFVFAKYEFRGKNLLFLFILATMMVPQQATMIPSFLLIQKLGLYDNLASLVLPRMVGGFGIFLCRQFIADIPDDLMDAAQIDGAGDMFIYRKLILPLIMPAISALAIFTFLEKWNDYLGPLLYLSKTTNMTMPLALSFFSSQHFQDIDAIMAAATIIMLPVTVVFLAFQKQFVEGIAITGMK
ncbi:MAG: carbohydrate ABC transporter permease [Clostridia bacterium]|nr:carbohydrate ABC transporter permease [Clostridia bacterium]